MGARRLSHQIGRIAAAAAFGAALTLGGATAAFASGAESPDDTTWNSVPDDTTWNSVPDDTTWN